MYFRDPAANGQTEAGTGATLARTAHKRLKNRVTQRHRQPRTVIDHQNGHAARVRVVIDEFRKVVAPSQPAELREQGEVMLFWLPLSLPGAVNVLEAA